MRMTYTTRIDKLELSNISVCSFGSDDNFRALMDEQIVTVNRKPGYTCRDKEQKHPFSKLKIVLKDSVMRKFEISANKYNPYCRMELSIQDSKWGNMQGYTVNEYKEKLRNVCKYLKEEMHIEIDASEAKIVQIEINKTIPLDGEFDAYSRPLKVMYYNSPSQYQGKADYQTKDGKYTGYKTATYKDKVSSSYEVLKVYDKKMELKKKHIYINDNLARVEFTLVGKRRIKKELCSNKFWELEQENVDSFFSKRVQEIKDNCSKWKNKQFEILLADFEKCKADSHQWRKECLDYLLNKELKENLPQILHISDLYPVVKEINNQNNRKRQNLWDFKQKMNDYISGKNHVFFIDDNEKLKEIFEKLM